MYHFNIIKKFYIICRYVKKIILYTINLYFKFIYLLHYYFSASNINKVFQIKDHYTSRNGCLFGMFLKNVFLFPLILNNDL